jgi:hypothetical protein
MLRIKLSGQLAFKSMDESCRNSDEGMVDHIENRRANFYLNLAVRTL